VLAASKLPKGFTDPFASRYMDPILVASREEDTDA
jgi:hypothetical protein